MLTEIEIEMRKGLFLDRICGSLGPSDQSRRSYNLQNLSHLEMHH